MWCVSCKVFFSWKTGNVILTGPLHNPEYYRWMRENNQQIPRNDNEEACGLPPMRRIALHADNLKLPREFNDFLYDFHQRVNHIQNWTLPRLPNAADPDMNADLRLSYLLEQITAEELKVKVQQRDKKQLKNMAYRRIYEVFVAGSSDQFNNFLTLTKDWNNDKQAIHDCLKCMTTLLDFCNKSFMELSHKFQSVPLRIAVIYLCALENLNLVENL
jgi:hypothetical protein